MVIQIFYARSSAGDLVNLLILFFTVGGLGLNLTSADTLVFMEHDWNPMKDLQVILFLLCSILIDMLFNYVDFS